MGLALALAASFALAVAADPPPKLSPAESAKAKKALQEVQDFMGIWNLEGSQKVGGKETIWKEKVDWSWKFNAPVPTAKVKFGEGKGKFLDSGEMTYALDKKKYQLVLTTADKTEQVLLGELKAGRMKMDGKDAKTGDTYRLTMETLADGIRFAFKLEKQEGGKGPFSTAFSMLGNKDGESLAGGGKKPECIVTGGAASIAVSFGGQQYFVCCSGCRDAFNETPEKFIKAAAAKK